MVTAPERLQALLAAYGITRAQISEQADRHRKVGRRRQPAGDSPIGVTWTYTASQVVAILELVQQAHKLPGSPPVAGSAAAPIQVSPSIVGITEIDSRYWWDVLFRGRGLGETGKCDTFDAAMAAVQGSIESGRTPG